MILYPAVIVHGLADVKAALEPGLPVTLLSGVGAALYGGAGWWHALMAAGREAFPATPIRELLDCADAPGRAMEALRGGVSGLVLDPSCRAFPEVAKTARATGALLLPVAPPALDLAKPGSREGLRAWLAQQE